MADQSAPSFPVIPVSASTQPGDRIDYQRPEYKAGSYARTLCRDLMDGTQAVQAKGTVYLPKWPAEKDDKYKIRASITQVARYYQRTVQASVGMICSTPPKLNEDADPILLSDAEDIDGKGTHAEVFAAQVTTDAINGGFCAVLVDAPPIPDGLSLTLADEQALGLRPFWVSVTADQLISWIVDTPDWGQLLRDWQAGILSADQVQSYARQTIVRQVVIHEPTDVRSGSYGVACKDRYRVLTLADAGVTFEVWEHRKADGATGEHFIQLSAGMMRQAKQAPFREIPLAIVYAGRKLAPFVAHPPLLPLAEMNLDHYQVSADRRYLMRLCHAPTLGLFGFTEERDENGRPKKIEVGPNSVITSSDSSAKAAYIAADPNALQSSQEERTEIVQQMATLGMSFLEKERRGTLETATGRALDAAAEQSTHATTARGLQDGLEQAWKYHAMYRGVAAPEVTVNTTYASPAIDPQMAAVLWQAVAADRLDMDSFIEYITTGSLPDDVQVRLNVLQLMQATPAVDDDPTTQPAGTPGASKFSSKATPDATDEPSRIAA